MQKVSRDGVRIGKALGELKLDVHKVTKGLAHSPTEARARSGKTTVRQKPTPPVLVLADRAQAGNPLSPARRPVAAMAVVVRAATATRAEMAAATEMVMPVEMAGAMETVTPAETATATVPRMATRAVMETGKAKVTRKSNARLAVEGGNGRGVGSSRCLTSERTSLSAVCWPRRH